MWFFSFDWRSIRSNLTFYSWDYRWFAFTSFTFLCRKEKFVKGKKHLVLDLILPPDIYVQMYFVHIRIHICRDLVHLDSLGLPGVSSRPLGSQLSTPCVQCVCVWAYTHTTPTYTSTHVKNREDTDNTPISSAVKNDPQRQVTRALVHYLDPPFLVPQRWMNKLHIYERICASCSERVRKWVRWWSQHLSNVHTCTCMVLTTPVEMHVYSLIKCTCTRACVPMQQCVMKGVANLSWVLHEHCAGCCLPSALLFVSKKSVARHSLIKKSVQIHAISWRGHRCSVAQASFDHPC